MRRQVYGSMTSKLRNENDESSMPFTKKKLDFIVKAVTIASRHVICKYANMLLNALHWLLPFALFSLALAEVICDNKVVVGIDKRHFGVHEIGGGSGIVKNSPSQIKSTTTRTAAAATSLTCRLPA
jgi:hypothetical protein